MGLESAESLVASSYHDWRMCLLLLCGIITRQGLPSGGGGNREWRFVGVVRCWQRNATHRVSEFGLSSVMLRDPSEAERLVRYRLFDIRKVGRGRQGPPVVGAMSPGDWLTCRRQVGAMLKRPIPDVNLKDGGPQGSKAASWNRAGLLT